MRFTLVYDGPLSSAGNKPKKDQKWAIRKQLDPQLRHLWRVNQDLANLRSEPRVREDGQYVMVQPHLTCSLTIQFLKQEQRGKVYQGGDLDGRIKLLLDALSVPQNENEIPEGEPASGEPIHCLVEDDRLVTGFEVRSEQLLAAPDADENYVRLVVGVSIAVARARPYNAMFSGGS